MQIKTKRYHCTDPEWLKFKRPTRPNISKNMGQLQGILTHQEPALSTNDEHAYILRSGRSSPRCKLRKNACTCTPKQMYQECTQWHYYIKLLTLQVNFID